MSSAAGWAGAEPAKDRVLVIGKARSALSAADAEGDQVWEWVANPLEGIHAASVRAYRGIAVVTQGLLYRLRPIVAALQQNYEGRIVFLCQMVEEPLVRHFIQRHGDPQTSEMDYLICPISVERLASLFEGGGRTEDRLSAGCGQSAGFPQGQTHCLHRGCLSGTRGH